MSEIICKEAGWTPVLRGDAYCSPLCGGDCKKADYDRAVEKASALAARLGTGWKPRVWENLGWHYKAIKGVCEVYEYKNNRVSVILRTRPEVVVSGHDPVDAVGLAIHEARTCLLRTEQQLAEIGDEA